MTVKRTVTKEEHSKESLTKLLKNMNVETTNVGTENIMEIEMGVNKIKNLYKSFDGAVMSSTIANIDIEELVYAFAGLVETKVICASEPITHISKKFDKLKEK